MIGYQHNERTVPAPKQGGFSLIELLVVIATITLLVSTVFPSLRRARETARRTVCGAHLREVGRALDCYAQAQDDYYPTAEAPRGRSGAMNWWMNETFLRDLAVEPCPQGRSILTCPSDRHPNVLLEGGQQDCWISYAANASAFGMRRGRSKRGRRRNQVERPAEALGFCDAIDTETAAHVVGWQGCVSQSFAYRHQDRCAAVFLDSHVDWLRAGSVPMGPIVWEQPFWGNIPCFDEP